MPPLSQIAAGETLHQLHNRLAPQLITDTVQPMLEAGGDVKSVLVLLESVACGVLLAAVKLGGDEAVLDVFQANVRRRLAEARLALSTSAALH